jgi:pullulanase/glycogen debranching enzyme
VYSSTATRIEVCLFAEVDGAPVATIVLPGRSGHVHHGFVPGLQPGQLYGLRAHGAFAPEAGLLHDPNRLLVDPYARAIAWPTRASPAAARGRWRCCWPYDNAATAPKGVVIGEDVRRGATTGRRGGRGARR